MGVRMYAVPMENAVRDEIGPSKQTTAEAPGSAFWILSFILNQQKRNTYFIFGYFQLESDDKQCRD